MRRVVLFLDGRCLILVIAPWLFNLYGYWRIMRMIGELSNEADARVFSDFLYARGIKNDVEAEKEGGWIIWVHAEEELDHAKDLLEQFRSNSGDPEYKRVAKQAREMRLLEQEKEEAAAKRYFDSRRVFRQEHLGMGRLTAGLIGISVLVWVFRELGGNKDFWNFLFISELMEPTRAARLQYGLQEVRQGQIWRLLTPIFLHFGVLHILFNMLWLRDLGSMIERREGTWLLGLQVLAIGICANVAQYYVSGPAFGGMSGVVYGLLGYVWMKATFDPASGYFLHQTTVVLMLIWFVFGFVGVLKIANTVHTVGLGMGVAWGYISARRAGY